MSAKAPAPCDCGATPHWRVCSSLPPLGPHLTPASTVLMPRTLSRCPHLPQTKGTRSWCESCRAEVLAARRREAGKPPTARQVQAYTGRPA
jgi:hypothetical protein